jgi:hypothetical protein
MQLVAPSYQQQVWLCCDLHQLKSILIRDFGLRDSSRSYNEANKCIHLL